MSASPSGSGARVAAPDFASSAPIRSRALRMFSSSAGVWPAQPSSVSAHQPAADDLESQVALALGDHAAAVAPLERCITANPRFMTMHYNLANAYVMTNHPDWARREMEKTTLLEPQSLRTLR